MNLWHYTCQHGRDALGLSGTLLPPAMHSAAAMANLAPGRQWMARLVWMTDLDTPIPEALGLTSMNLECDRTLYRYRATDPMGVQRYVRVRRTVVPLRDRQTLEAVAGAMPAHWYVATGPVPVVLAQP